MIDSFKEISVISREKSDRRANDRRMQNMMVNVNRRVSQRRSGLDRRNLEVS